MSTECITTADISFEVIRHKTRERRNKTDGKKHVFFTRQIKKKNDFRNCRKIFQTNINAIKMFE